MSFIRSEPTEQEIASMLSNLEQAHKNNAEAKKAYQAEDYRAALQNYHHCMLYARAVVQLTTSNLREMARAQLMMSEHNKEGELKESKQIAKKEAKEEKTTAIAPGDEDASSLSNGPATVSPAATSSQSRSRLDSTTRGQEISQEAKELITKCYNNLAACILARPSSSNNKDDYLRAVFYCDNVLKEEPDNEKANFRKGVALMKAGNMEKAIEQFEQCKNNAQAKVHIGECQRSIDEDRRRRDAEIRANFAKANFVLAAADGEQQNNGNANGHPPGLGGNQPAMNGHVHHQ